MTTPDVLICGGGPSGATLGALLAKEGMNVTVVEKARFPRPHIGEALQPAAVELLDFYLGLGPTLASAGFIKKYGAIYEWGERTQRWSVLFDDRLDSDLHRLDAASLEAGDFEHSYQVDRAVFDQILLDHAVERGCTLLEETEALGPIEEDGRVVGMRVRDAEGEREIRASLTVDATGTRCVLGRHFDLTRNVPDLQATATWCYVQGAGGVKPPLHRNVQVVVTVPEGWVWFIPLSDDRTSIGVVTHERAKVTPERFWKVLGQTSLPLENVQIMPDEKGQEFHHMKDWSYSHERFVGPGWILLGDAACFTDPILSGGVDFGVRSACNASLAILSGRDKPTGLNSALQGYERQLRKEYQAYLRVARYWYANNRAVDGLFWEMHRLIPIGSISTPLRAFKYLTSGKCDADAHFHLFSVAQEQRIFRELGVDEDHLKDALRRAQRHLDLRGPEKGDGK
jgi:flavin-dependent dehydrogenase